jgi:hypothetical protein
VLPGSDRVVPSATGTRVRSLPIRNQSLSRERVAAGV